MPANRSARTITDCVRAVTRQSGNALLSQSGVGYFFRPPRLELREVAIPTIQVDEPAPTPVVQAAETLQSSR